MYPNRELIRLAAHKAVLRRKITHHRIQCVEAAAQVARPLEWLDRVLAFWRRLSPLAQIAAVPLGLLVKRTIFRRLKTLGSLARWGPMVFGAMRGIRSVLKPQSEPAQSSNGRS